MHSSVNVVTDDRKPIKTSGVKRLMPKRYRSNTAPRQPQPFDGVSRKHRRRQIRLSRIVAKADSMDALRAAARLAAIPAHLLRTPAITKLFKDAPNAA